MAIYFRTDQNVQYQFIALIHYENDPWQFLQKLNFLYVLF